MDKKSKLYRVCPQCGSTNTSFYAREGPSLEICKDCDFHSVTFPEVEDVKEFKKLLARSRSKNQK